MNLPRIPRTALASVSAATLSLPLFAAPLPFVLGPGADGSPDRPVATILTPALVGRTHEAPGGDAVVFDASSDALAAAESPGLVVGRFPGRPTEAPAAFTLAAWVRPDTFAPFSPVFSRTADADGWSDGFIVFLDADGIPGLMVGAYAAGAVAAAPPSCSLRPGEWRHLALVSDGDTSATLYLDGEPVASVPASPGPVDAPLVVGPRTGSAPRPFVGAVAGVRLFDAPLSLDSLAALAVPDEKPGAEAVAPAPEPASRVRPEAAAPTEAVAKTSTPSSCDPPAGDPPAVPVSAPLLRVWSPME